MAKILFYFLIVLLPWGIFKNYVFDFSLIDSRKIIYLIPRIYGTDTLLLALLLISLTGLIAHPRKVKKPLVRILPESLNSGLPGAGFLFIIFLSLSSLFSVERSISFYYLARFILYYGFYLWLRRDIRLAKDFPKIISLLLVPITLESLLALSQFLKQGFVWGFWPLGEPSFLGSGRLSPLVNLVGNLKLRAFGTFPHPNVLGGFLAVSLIWVGAQLVTGATSIKRKLIFGAILVLGTTALFLSFSQAAWGAFLLGLFLYEFWAWVGNNNGIRRWFGLILIGLVLLSLLLNIQNLPLERPGGHRFELARVAFQVFKKEPLWGVGLGNFVRFAPADFAEPVHNIYLLILAEAGLPALIALIYFLISRLVMAGRTEGREKKILAVSLTQLLFLGSFDHYLLTSQQGALLFWLVLGLISAQEK